MKIVKVPIRELASMIRSSPYDGDDRTIVMRPSDFPITGTVVMRIEKMLKDGLAMLNETPKSDGVLVTIIITQEDKYGIFDRTSEDSERWERDEVGS